MLNEIDLSRTDLNLLVLFHVVLDERHVGRAAERLSLSPSAVSHGLGRLRRLLNDPLFLRTPKGVVPSARALELAEPIGDILARARRVVASGAPFNARTSARRFFIGSSDGISAVLLPPLLAGIGLSAAGIGLIVRHVSFETVLVDLDARVIDVAIMPLDAIPARFAARTLYEEDFVIATRADHPYACAPSLARFCEMSHLLVALRGDPHGFVDEALARRGLKRHVALAVPNFMQALALVADSDLLAALPRRLVALHARRFSVVATEPPLPLIQSAIRAVVPKVALMDEGVSWLLDTLEGTLRATTPAQTPSPASKQRRR